jgi:protocatechuate 3,4-dioxygenase beta subunit
MLGSISGMLTAAANMITKAIACAVISPLEYLFRAAHIHVKVRATENSPVLTTQLFFPGEKKNATDPIFETLTVMDVADTKGGQKAVFDFVVEVD